MFNLKKNSTEKFNFKNNFFFKIRLEFKFQEHSYRKVSIQEQTRILISRTSWKFFSREQSVSFYFKNVLEFYFMNSLSICSRTDRIYFKRSLEGFISRTIGSLIL